jgi:hypothetical protein
MTMRANGKRARRGEAEHSAAERRLLTERILLGDRKLLEPCEGGDVVSGDSRFSTLHNNRDRQRRQ